MVTTIFLLIDFPSSVSPSPLPSPNPIPMPESDSPMSHPVSQWATFLGVSSALLAAIQYLPQVVHTFRHKVVGALSIPMMCIQTPGAVVMVLSIARRAGTNWTSWSTFAVAGILQGTLLVMCIIWKIRQHRLGLDNFGNSLLDDPLASSYLSMTSSVANGYGASSVQSHPAADVGVPGLVVDDEDAAAVRVALANTLELAVEEDVRSGGFREATEIPISEHDIRETTPLLRKGKNHDEESGGKGSNRWFGWF